MGGELNHCYCLNKNSEYEFIRWIIEALGPVLLGVKPSEILSFPGNDLISIRKKEEVKSIINISSKVCYKEFNTLNGCSKILFYNYLLLEDTLRENRNLRFLKGHNYPKEYNLDNYLNHMIEKMQNGVIPHEIGVFLGYPLKDVIGFMGHPSLKLTKVCGWKVYGDTRLSDKKYREIINAKNQIRTMLQINEPEEIIQLA
ncbi:DUF3793 family protein [Alkaliphilus peptidifermentans]|uniref:DUF3793 family protein n=1 Tax=Alkaliphilus peptidifermentans DSM 18978 TaxID=1120976 RepID=A0A1G5CEX8_9FIRM|nr:DUF3793 family protein [Alkaliphilus peptidifermentans]SCY01085.1 Protein of unknown function [Alkaliphilus peptidifermentans DSM 18978]